MGWGTYPAIPDSIKKTHGYYRIRREHDNTVKFVLLKAKVFYEWHYQLWKVAVASCQWLVKCSLWWFSDETHYSCIDESFPDRSMHHRAYRPNLPPVQNIPPLKRRRAVVWRLVFTTKMFINYYEFYAVEDKHIHFMFFFSRRQKNADGYEKNLNFR